VFVFPDDYNRVVLEHSVEYGDYINASYVDVSFFIMVVMGCFLKLVKKICFHGYDDVAEPVASERVHSESGTDREHGRGFLADGLAEERLLHHHAHQDVRLHQGNASLPWQQGIVM
jgi:hypothetical protein